jgi:hypothetical protein
VDALITGGFTLAAAVVVGWGTQYVLARQNAAADEAAERRMALKALADFLAVVEAVNAEAARLPKPPRMRLGRRLARIDPTGLLDLFVTLLAHLLLRVMHGDRLHALDERYYLASARIRLSAPAPVLRAVHELDRLMVRRDFTPQWRREWAQAREAVISAARSEASA